MTVNWMGALDQVVLRREQAAQSGTDSEDIEEVAGDEFARRGFRGALVGKVHANREAGDQAIEHPPAIAQAPVFGVGEQAP